MFNQDNALVHTSVITVAKINELQFKLHPYAPYSPDLAFSDYYFSTNLKKWLVSQRFANNDEVEFAVNTRSHGVPTPIYFEGVLTDGGGANEFISATYRGLSRN